MKYIKRLKPSYWGYLATASDIEGIEKKIGSTLPSDYVDFMKQYNDFNPEPQQEYGYCYNVNWSENQDERLKLFNSVETLEEWFIIHPEPPLINTGGIASRVSNVSNAIETYLEKGQERIPIDTIPIASTGGSHLLLMGVGENNYEKIFYWVMDLECEPGEPTYDNVGFVASSFSEFLDSLYPCEAGLKGSFPD